MDCFSHSGEGRDVWSLEYLDHFGVVRMVLDEAREVEDQPEMVRAILLALPDRVVEPQAAVVAALARPRRVDRASGARAVRAVRVGRLPQARHSADGAARGARPAGAGGQVDPGAPRVSKATPAMSSPRR